MADAVKYNDPTVLAMADSTEQKLGLPSGLLSSIITRGEKSNSDQVSSAGARTVAQITPSTRNLAIKAYGIDPYLSQQNAIEVAGNLLKDSLDRNDGDVGAAVSEYHGGTNRDNWGPITQAYTKRVLAGLPDAASNAPIPAPATAVGAPSTGGSTGSTFDQAMAAQAAGQAGSVANVFKAYQSGQMSSQDAQAFEDHVNAGTILLPRGASLNGAPMTAAPTQAATQVPDAVVQAYQSGQMSQQDRQDFESLVKAGQFSLPQGVQLGQVAATPSPSLMDRAAAIPGAIAESFTGRARSTPTMDSLPDYASSPEMNSMSMASAKSGLGTMFAGSQQEIAQVLKANYPNLQFGQDEKGNPYFVSQDGQTYGIKPGGQLSDIPRGLGQIGAFVLGNEIAPGSGVRGILPNMVREGAVGAGTQAAIETTKAASGGNFDASSVGTAGLMGAAAPVVGKVVNAATDGAVSLLSRVRGVPDPAAVAQGAAPAADGAIAPQMAPAAAPDAAPVADAVVPSTDALQARVAAALVPKTHAAATPDAIDAAAQAAARLYGGTASANSGLGSYASDLVNQIRPPVGSPAEGAALDAKISRLEGQYADLLGQTSGAASPGGIREAKLQLSALTKAPVDTSPEAIQAVAKQLQTVRRLPYKTALAQAKVQVSDQAEDYSARVASLQKAIQSNKDAETATQKLHDIGSQLTDLRSQRAAMPPTLNPIASAVQDYRGTVGAVPDSLAPAVDNAAVTEPVQQAPSATTVVDKGASVASTSPAVAPTLRMSSNTPPRVPVASAAEAATPMSADALAATARSAGQGDKNAIDALAQQAAPDAKTVASAKRLGIEDYLQPDHVTTNQAYRELAQAVKSVPGSATRSAELDGLQQVGQRASSLIDELGGTSDLSGLSNDVRAKLQTTQTELDSKAEGLYSQLKNALPAKTEAPAPTVLSFIQQRAKDLGGVENLSPLERSIVKKLTPKPMSVAQQADPLMAGSGAGASSTTVLKPPTYALLDDVRKTVGAAARMAGPFKDGDTGLAKKLYSLISNDQEAVAGAHGMAEKFNAAKQAVQMRKSVEDDLTSLFGKQLDRSFVGTGPNSLNGAFAAASKGDASGVARLLSSVPASMRPSVVTSGIATAFRNAKGQGDFNFNNFSNWYEGLQRNRQAYTAVMANLPLSARKQFAALYNVSKGVQLATRERITTGRIMAVKEQLKGADTLMGRLYDAAKQSAGRVVGAAVVGHVAGPGIGAAVGSALTQGTKPEAIKAVDELISSPEFAKAVTDAAKGNAPQAAKTLGASARFSKFVKAVGSPTEMTDRQRWILQALQANNSQGNH